MLRGNAVAWTSNIDGFLGNGDDLKVVTLSEGRHAIAFGVTDADGNRASDTRTLQLMAPRPS